MTSVWFSKTTQIISSLLVNSMIYVFWNLEISSEGPIYFKQCILNFFLCLKLKVRILLPELLTFRRFKKNVVLNSKDLLFWFLPVVMVLLKIEIRYALWSCGEHAWFSQQCSKNGKIVQLTNVSNSKIQCNYSFSFLL